MLLLATMAGAAAVGAWALRDPVIAEWSCSWRGRALRLVARQNTQVLYVDGVEVARKTTLKGSGATLAWRVESEGAEVVLRGTVVHREGGGVVGTITADGERIGGSEGPDGGAGVSGAPGQRAPEPTHPLWGPAKVLLADLVATGGNAEAAQRIDAGLRDVLARLARLDGAAEAHQALGGEGEAVAEARERLEVQAGALLDALRAFHVIALGHAGEGSTERLDELLARVAADAEVEAPARRGRPGVTEG